MEINDFQINDQEDEAPEGWERTTESLSPQSLMEGWVWNL